MDTYNDVYLGSGGVEGQAITYQSCRDGLISVARVRCTIDAAGAAANPYSGNATWIPLEATVSA
jgi:hypothetical protein